MGRTVLQSKVADAEKLISESNLSLRRIAAIVGLSRGVVNDIANNKYNPKSLSRERTASGKPKRASKPRTPRPLHGEHSHHINANYPEPVRCPGCGAKVYPPCVACEQGGVTRNGVLQ